MTATPTMERPSGTVASVERRELHSTTGKMQAQDVSVHYGRSHALRGVSLDLAEREITALIGPSGCGKSTVIRAPNRVHDVLPNARVTGSVLLDGADIHRPGIEVTDVRRRVGMVFQRPNPFPRSVFENVVYGPRIHGVRRRAELDEIVERCLRAAALWEEVKDALQKSALDLSGGQQQRLCIARALAVDPEVLLMDEPCSALDPVSTARIEELMRQLRERYTLVLVTHNMHQALRVSQKPAFFLLGELVEAGRTSRIFEAPTDRRTADYVQGKFG